MEQSPYQETNSHSVKKCLAYHGTRRFITVFTCPPLDPILNHITLVHILAPYFCKTHFNIILHSAPRPSKWSLPFGFPTKILYAFFISAMFSTVFIAAHHRILF